MKSFQLDINPVEARRYKAMTSILAISAHPDDELFAGGTLAMFAKQGHDVYILHTTRGEGGEVGEPPLTTPENLGMYREQEARKAAHELGARDIFFLPYIDPYMEINGVARQIDVPLEEFAKSIGEYIEKIQPELIISHGSSGEYGHPQHIYTHQATRKALANGSPDTAFMSWCAWHEPAPFARILNSNDRADIVRDVMPWFEAKVAAALCHQTQHAMFLRNTGAPSVRDMISKTESFRIWQGTLPGEIASLFQD
jgi:LmbE family N-acetylglucosaminyl deacetylase